MRLAWLHCYNGISGDMALGALVDAGANPAYIGKHLAGLGLPDLAIEVHQVERGGIGATLIEVTGTGQHRETDRPYSEIVDLIDAADLPERARHRALSIFGALAKVESTIHRVTADQVTFHEIGGYDCIADIVGVCLALEDLGIDKVYASAVALGSGSVSTRHGRIPNPAPATIRLLAGAPVLGSDSDIELTTPTGAAILRGVDAFFGPMPAMKVKSSGYGAGRADPAGVANCLQVVVGDDETGGNIESRILTVVESNVDDATGEILGHTLSRLMEAGAFDAWATPTTGKKGRPAHTISALTTPERASTIAELLADETGTLGVRSWQVDRTARARELRHIDVDGLSVRIKVSDRNVKPEYDDASALAERDGTSLRAAVERIMDQWRREER